MEKNQHIARLIETSKTSLEPTARTSALCFSWKRRPRSQCVVCLHVHHIRGLPPETNGQFITVGWKTRGSKGEKTLPIEVSQGAACFDELFLHYCSSVQEVRSALKGLVISVDRAECNLGSFKIDLSEVGLAENLNPRHGGKVVSLDLEGIGNGGVLSVGVYCRVLEEEEEANSDDLCMKNDASKKQSKNKCFSCLPDLKRLRIRPQTVPVRKVPSVRPQQGSTTTEVSITKQRHPQDDEDEGEGFITIEKGVFHARPRRPPSDDLRNTDDDEEFEDDWEDEKPCLLMELNSVEQFDVDRVEDEFLRMLEAKCWKKGKKGDRKGKGVEGSLDHGLSLDLGVDLDLDALIKEAEMELNRAAHVWRSRVGGAMIEKEEYEELMNRWGANDNTASSGCSWVNGFGSPF